MARRTPVVAICYDFDGTLSPGNMQEYGFFSRLGKDAETFWNRSTDFAKANHADPILAYMKLMVDEALVGNMKTTRQAFRDYGKTVEFFPGVETWFDRIAEYGDSMGLRVEHYVVSSGLKEMIEGTPIKRRFKKIYACSFIYDNNGAAQWPAVAVNYTTKTQFLFRINKGIADDNDNTKINEYVPEEERRIPFSRMVYIGDGSTDIPCMKLVKDKGGYSIAVHDPTKRKKKQETAKLLRDGRVTFVAEADYREGSHLDSILKATIHGIAARQELAALARPPKPSKEAVVVDDSGPSAEAADA